MKTILVPISRMNEAISAIKFATQLSVKSGADIELFLLEEESSHGYSWTKKEVSSPVFKETSLIDHVDRYAQCWSPEDTASATDIQGYAMQDADLIVTDTAVVRGRYEIAAGAEAEGTKGLFAFDEFFMDDFAEGTKGVCAAHELPLHPAVEALMNQVRCPVVTVISQKEEVIPINSVVLVTDGEEGAAPLFTIIAQLQRIYKFKLYLLHINRCFRHQPVIATVNSMRELAKAHSFTNYQIQIIEDYTYEEGVIHFATKVQPDMIALPVDGHKVISQLLESVLASERNSSVKYLLTYKIS